MTETTLTSLRPAPDLVPTLTKVVQATDLDPSLLLRLQNSAPGAQDTAQLTQQIMQSLRPEMDKWLESVVKTCVSEVLSQVPR